MKSRITQSYRAGLGLVALAAMAMPAWAAPVEGEVATSKSSCATFLIGDAQNHYILARTSGSQPPPREGTPIRGELTQLGTIPVEVGPRSNSATAQIEILKVGSSAGDTVPAYMSACGE